MMTDMDTDLHRAFDTSQAEPSTVFDCLLQGMERTSTRLGLPGCRVLAYRESVPVGMSGVYVSLVDVHRAFHIGLLSDPVGCRELSEAATASGERMSMVAGLCKLTMDLVHGFGQEIRAVSLRAGIPIFSETPPFVCSNVLVETAHIALGRVRAMLALFQRTGDTAFPLLPIRGELFP
jgi:hypothetical protein